MNSVWRRIFLYLLACLLFAVSSRASQPLLEVKPLTPEPDFFNNSALSTAPPALTWVHGSALAGAALLVPAMSVLGALLANPQWLVINELLSSKSKISYIDHTTSQATIPLTALFAFLGTAPLWGILLSEGVR